MDNTQLPAGEKVPATPERVLYFHQVTRAYLKQCADRIWKKSGRRAWTISGVMMGVFIAIALALGKFPSYIMAIILASIIWPLAHLIRFSSAYEAKHLGKTGYAFWITSKRVISCKGDAYNEDILEKGDFQNLHFTMDLTLTSFILYEDYQWSNTFMIEFAPFRYLDYLKYIDRRELERIWTALVKACAANPLDLRTGEIQLNGSDRDEKKIFILTRGREWDAVGSCFVPSPEKLPQIFRDLNAIMQKYEVLPAARNELRQILPVTPGNLPSHEVKKNWWTKWLRRREKDSLQVEEQRKLEAERYNQEAPATVSQDVLCKELKGEPALWTGRPHRYLVRRTMHKETVALLVLVVFASIFFISWPYSGLFIKPSLYLPPFLMILIFLSAFTLVIVIDLVEKCRYWQESYVVTPTRVLIFKGQVVHTIPLKDILHFTVRPDILPHQRYSHTNIGHVILSSEILSSVFDWRRGTTLSYIDDVWGFRNVLYKLLPPREKQ